jgi:hypothetical protein
MKALIVAAFAAVLAIPPIFSAQGAEGAAPVFNCVIETEFEALSPDLPEGGFRAPQWDVEFEFDTASGMLRYRNLDLGGFDPPRRWDVIQRGGDGMDWIAVYRPELGPERNTRVLDASVVLRIRTWASDRVPGSEVQQNRFYILQYGVLGVGHCAAG